jgi:uncharacterized phiE125 gp8 family phage protein
MKGFLRIDHDDDDQLLHMLIVAARVMVEAKTARFLLQQTWRFILNTWPVDKVISIPLRPLMAFSEAWIVAESGELKPIPKRAFLVDTLADPGKLIQVDPVPEPAHPQGGIILDVHIGYGATREEVPMPLRQAIRMLAAYWFENRGDALDQRSELPAGVMALLSPFSPVRL